MSESAVVRPAVHIFATTEKLAAAAAELFHETAHTAVGRRGVFSVALSGGGTPRALYQLLAQPPYEQALPWSRTHVFWGDERMVPPDDEQSNYRQASAALLSHVAVPPAHVHRARGELEAQLAVTAYCNELRHFTATYQSSRAVGWPRFDLILLGLGSDGHTASLFPGAASSEWDSMPVVGVTAQYDGRPARRLTLTPPVINDARHILFLVTGASKASAAAATLYGAADVDRWPAQRIRPPDGQVTWHLDEAAAANLR